MIKFIVVTLVTIMFLAFLVESTSYPCNKEFIKKMVVAACGMKKRSTRSVNVESKLRLGLKSDIDQEFQQLIDDIVKNEEELHSETLNVKQLEESSVRLQLPSHLSVYLDWDDWKSNTSVLERQLNQDVEQDRRSTRSLIMDKIEECCHKKCTVEDFLGICEKR